MKRLLLLTIFAAAAACSTFDRGDEVTPGNDAGMEAGVEAGSDGSIRTEAGTDAGSCGIAPFTDSFEDPGDFLARGWTDKVESGASATAVPTLDPAKHPGEVLDIKVPKLTGLARAFFYIDHGTTPSDACPSWRYTMTYSARITPLPEDGDRVHGPRLAAVFLGHPAGTTGIDNQLGVGLAFGHTNVQLDIHAADCKNAPENCGDGSLVDGAPFNVAPDAWHLYSVEVDYLAGATSEKFGVITVTIDGLKKGIYPLPVALAKGGLQSQVGLTSALDPYGPANLEIDDVDIRFGPGN